MVIFGNLSTSKNSSLRRCLSRRSLSVFMLDTSNVASIVLVSGFAESNCKFACNPFMLPPVLIPRFFIWNLMTALLMAVFCALAIVAKISRGIIRATIRFILRINDVCAGYGICVGFFTLATHNPTMQTTAKFRFEPFLITTLLLIDLFAAYGCYNAYYSAKFHL